VVGAGLGFAFGARMRNCALLAFAAVAACVDVEDPGENPVDDDPVTTEPIESHGTPPYCPLRGTHWDPAVHQIDVWVASDAQFLNRANTAATDTEMGLGFRVLLNELDENLPVDLHLRYRGRASGTGVVPGSITIRSVPLGSQAWPNDVGSDNDIDQCRIDLGYGALNSSTTLHEIQHCLGFHHPHECGTHAPSMMGYNAVGPNGTWNDGAQVYRKYDIDGLHWAYGYRIQYGHAWSIDATGTTWTEQTFSSPFDWSRGPLSSCNGLAANGDQVLFTNLLANKPQRWDVSANTVTYVPSAESMTPAGIACDSAGGYMAAYIDEDGTTGDATHAAYVFNGTTGMTQTILTSWNGVSDQLRAAFDPASGRYVLAYEARETGAGGGSRPNLDIKVVGGGSPTTLKEDQYGGYAAIPSVGTPNIACGPVSVVGAENCLVAWVAGEWKPTLRWVHGHIDTTTNRFVYNQANIRTSTLTVWGGPAIAYTGNAAAPWLLVYHYGDRYLWSFKKSSSLTASWQYTGIAEGPAGHRFTMPTILSYLTRACRACSWVPTFRVYAKSYPVP